MYPTRELITYDTSERNPSEDFDSAVDFLGEEWLKQRHAEYYDTGNDGEIDYIGDSPPSVVQWYHSARDFLAGTDYSSMLAGFEATSAIRFLEIGACVELLQGSRIVSSEGHQSERSLKQLYRPDLRTAGQNPEEILYELRTASWYAQAGHEIAFIDEDMAASKTPEFRIVDTSPHVDVECKRVRKGSQEEEKISRLLNEFINRIAKSVVNPFVAYLETDEDLSPEKLQTLLSNIDDYGFLTAETSISVPVGTLHLCPITESFPYRVFQRVIAKHSLLGAVSHLIVRPTIENGASFEVENVEQGAVLCQAKEGDPGLIGWCAWVGIDKDVDLSRNVTRAARQFRGTSEKFDSSRAGLLHVEIPEYQRFQSAHQLELRNAIAGELKPRSEITGVVLTANDYRRTDHGGKLHMLYTVVPHYSPDVELPDGFHPFGISFDSATSGHKRMDESLNEELSAQGVDGLAKILDQDSGHLQCCIGTELFYGSSAIAFMSESRERALVFGGTDDEWGQMEIVGTDLGVYRVSVPPRFRDLEKVNFDFSISPERFLVGFHPRVVNSNVRPGMIRLETPLVAPPKVGRETLLEIESRYAPD